jgi:hypothetical protein
MIMMGYDDWVFEFSPDCIKILRKWKVIDWCTYHPNNPYTTGICEYTQVIKVKPPGKPDIYCVPDVTVSANADCSGAYVQLDKVTAKSACGNPVPVKNNSPFAFSKGGDASGFYPIGKTKVVFTADDGCGHKVSCKVHITVKDLKKPTPVCINGLTANLMQNPDGYYIDIEGKWFDAGSYDNCTPDPYLKFDVYPKRFTCDELGENQVKVYVTDAHGNTQFCNTYIIIQDNMGMCPPPDTSSYPLSGVVMDEFGDPLSDVLVRLQASGVQLDVFTADDGSYLFPAVLNGEDYLIIPDVNNNFRDGISTFDILQIAKYIIGEETLLDGFDHLAADVDMSGTIDILDINELRSLLLYNVDELAHGHSWRFFPDDMNVDSIMENPLQHQLPGLLELLDLASAVTDINFVGVKLGDIDNSLADDRDYSPTELVIVDQLLSGGGEVNQVDVTLPSSKLVEGFQFALQLNRELVQRIDIKIDGEYLSRNMFSYDMDRGLLLITYWNINGLDLEKGETLMTFEITTATDVKVSDALMLHPQRMNPEIYSDNVKETLQLRFSDLDPSADLVEPIDKFGVTVFPNPTAGDLNIKIDAMDPGRLNRITMTSLSGVPVLDVETSSPFFVVDKTSLPAAGMYLLEVTSGEEKIVRKVMIQ